MCAIPLFDSVKWQQLVTVHEAAMAVHQVADAVQASKLANSFFALAARPITCRTFQVKQKLQKGLPFRDPFSQKVILTLVGNT
jgi:hypothetical protein